MTTHLLFAALVSVPALRFGPLRLSAFGASATVGVVLAMALSGRSARRLGVDPEAAWNTGLFAVASCFLASRLLLVLRDPVAFARFPLLVLALPSLTLGGLALAALLVAVYLRRKHLPLLTMLDLFAPSGAVVAAALEVGHWLEGSEPGMPIGFTERGRHWDTAVLHLYPVALIGALAAAALAVLLLRVLGQRKGRAGRVAALGLLCGGTAAFALSTLSLPEDPLNGGWLEPGQLAALGACVAGAVLWSIAPLRSGMAAPNTAPLREVLASGNRPLSLGKEAR